jgi:hypothetical protein
MQPLVSVLIAFSAAIGSIIALLRGRVLVMGASVGDPIAWAMGGQARVAAAPLHRDRSGVTLLSADRRCRPQPVWHIVCEWQSDPVNRDGFHQTKTPNRKWDSG